MIRFDDLARLAKAMNGLAIWGCLPGSAAALAGVRYGDILLAVNGQAVPNIDTYIQVVENLDRSLGRRQITVFRDGRELDLELVIHPPDDDDDSDSGPRREDVTGHAVDLTMPRKEDTEIN